MATNEVIEAPEEIRKRFPRGGRVVLSEYGVRTFPNGKTAGTVVGHARYTGFPRIRLDGNVTDSTWSPDFWELAEEGK